MRQTDENAVGDFLPIPTGVSGFHGSRSSKCPRTAFVMGRASIDAPTPFSHLIVLAMKSPGSRFSRARRAACVVAAALLTLAACGGGGSDAAIERDVSPVAADPSVSTATEAHVAITPAGSATGRLFVFLPGTLGLPTMYRLILRSGAARGFHALGINYPNNRAVGEICLGGSASCFTDVRREVITGTDSSSLVDVGPPDAIVTRIERALAYLHATYPDEGWGQYVSGGTVDWSKLVVAGHSQGGGHAGLMAKLFTMHRAVYFSSPADFAGAPAAWMSLPNATPASRQYGFGNVRDPAVTYDKLQANWSALGITSLGAPASVDTNTNGPFTSNLLTTSMDGRGGGVVLSPEHGSTVIDAATPLASDGTPLFDAVWNHLCFR
jgi:hypothetical protein